MSVSKKLIIALMAVITITFAIPFASYAFEAVTGVGTVTADSLNVRTGPGKDYDAMGKLYSGNVVDVLGIEDEWLKIEYQKQEGYVAMQYVDFEPDEIEVEPEEVIADEEVLEENETEDEPIYNYKLIFGLVGAIIVLFIVILVTIKSIKGMDEFDDDDDDDDEDDDEYDDDEYYEEDEEDYEEYEYVMVKRPKQNTNSQTSRQPQRNNKAVKRSDDYTLDIDPRYFD